MNLVAKLGEVRSDRCLHIVLRCHGIVGVVLVDYLVVLIDKLDIVPFVDDMGVGDVFIGAVMRRIGEAACA